MYSISSSPVSSGIPAGIIKGYDLLVLNIEQFGLMFSEKTEGIKHIGGFGTIAKMFNPYWDWQSFWNTTALLSVMLGVLNLLPIPALDGGHAMFLVYEMVSVRKPSDKFMETVQVIGFIILLALVIFANGNDIYKLFNFIV